MTLPRESLDFDSWNDSPAWIDEKVALPQMAGIPQEVRKLGEQMLCCQLLVNPSRFLILENRFEVTKAWQIKIGKTRDVLTCEH